MRAALLLLTLLLGSAFAQRYRVVVSSDIGGTDFDDYQSMAHLLVYADELDLEGLISSPYGPGRKQHILTAIDAYEKDFPNLSTYSARYPAPPTLRAIAKQGALESSGPAGFAMPSEGSEWIVRCARRDDPRPLHVLVWGGIDDLAQALHDAPDIVPKLRVHFIGGPNKKWSVNAYQYIATNCKTLWMIESNETYRGWFVGGDQTGEWKNDAFVKTHVAGHGFLGAYSATLGPTLKMGDSPSLARLLSASPGDPADPAKPGWGGQFTRAWGRPHAVYRRLTTARDTLEEFGVLELVLPLGPNASDTATVVMVAENLSLPGLIDRNANTVTIFFSPKTVGLSGYALKSGIATLDGKTGALTAIRPPAANKAHPAPDRPNWWTDDPSPELMESGFIGIKSVNRYRVDYLRDFAARMDRCAKPAAAAIRMKRAGSPLSTFAYGWAGYSVSGKSIPTGNRPIIDHRSGQDLSGFRIPLLFSP